ncbi:MAG: DUF3850 domain-containing protein [Fuerstiella sp.]|nr:DUF3850 domain-containing protein [Fuerstiella sp.]
MSTWQERLVEEKEQLDDRIERLVQFMNNGAKALRPEDFSVLTFQLGVMRQYFGILGRRIQLANLNEPAVRYFREVTHELKVWPEYFQPIIDGDKTFEGRKMNREYMTGDKLWLREWCPKDRAYTGRTCSAVIGDMLDGGKFGIEKGWCVMSLKDVKAL